MSDEVELDGELFRREDPPVPSAEVSGIMELAGVLVPQGEHAPRPPSLSQGLDIAWSQPSGLHSSLLSTSTQTGSAESWQELVDDLVAESKQVTDEALRAALLAEAGRILIDRLGRRDEGELLLRRSESPVSQRLLEGGRGGPLAGLAAELAELEAQGRDPERSEAERAAAWVEFGLLCEERTPSLARALAAYLEALELVPDHPEALGLAADAAILLEDERAPELLERRLARLQAPPMREACLLDMADLADDPARRRELLRQAHAIDPTEETALRRLIRATAQAEDPAALGALYRELARIAQDPVSRATALHLTFLTFSEADLPADDLVAEMARVADETPDRTDVLPPLSEVALYVERRVASYQDLSKVPSGIEVLERLWTCLDDPREQAFVREQLARLRLDMVRDAQGGQDLRIDESAAPEVRAQAARLEDDLRFCLTHMPEHHWASQALARLLTWTRDVPALVQHLEDWSRRQAAGPGRAEILLWLGEVHETMRNDPARAAEVYELAAAEDPDNTNCLRALGRTYERMRRWPQAIATLQRQAAHADDPTERPAALRRIAAMAEHELRDADLAVTTLEELTRADPDDLPALFRLAALARAHARTSVLVRTLEALVDRLDDDVTRTATLVELGQVQEHHLKRRALARECHERALALSPGYPPALDALARLVRDDGDFEALIDLLTPARNPHADPAVLAYRAARVALDDLGDMPRAIELVGRAYTLNPDLVPARELYLRLLTAAGHLRPAYDLLRAQEPPRSAPGRADHHYRLGLLAAAAARDAQGDEARALEDAALQHYRAALAAQPEHGLAAERCRRLLVAHGDLDNMVRHLRTRLEVVPEDMRAAFLIQIGRIRLLQGQPDEARACYEQAYQLAQGRPVVAREYETVLRLTRGEDTLPALFLSAAKHDADTHYKATVLVEAAEILIRSGAAEDMDLAASAVLDALRSDPGNPYAVRHLERLLGEPGIALDVREAVGARAVRAQSDAERAIFYLESAELLERDGQLTQARRAYAAALDALPALLPAELGIQRIATGHTKLARSRQSRASVHVLLAEARDAAVHAGAGDVAAARAALGRLEDVLSRAPEQRDALALGRALVEQLPDPTPAFELLARAFEQVRDPATRHDLGRFLGEHARRGVEAVHFLSAAVEARPQSRSALRDLIHAYRRTGDEAQAARTTERLLALLDPAEPSAVDLRLGLAAYLGQRDGELDRAIEHAKLALRARPDDVRVMSLIADLHERSGQAEEAAQVLDRLIARESDRRKLHDLLLRKGRLLERMPERHAAAIEALERAAGLMPGNRETLDLLVRLYERAKQPEKIGALLEPTRAAIRADLARGALSLRSLKILGRIARPSARELSHVIELVLYALDPNSTGMPEGHMQGAGPRGLGAILGAPEPRARLRGEREPEALDLLLQTLEPWLPRMAAELPILDDADLVAVPASADPQAFAMLLRQWAETLGLPTVEMGAAGTHNAAILIPGDPPTVRLGGNLWMQGELAGWRGLTAVALARHALGGARARALPPMDADLLLAAAFEVAEVFNPITADPDPRRLRDLSALLAKHLPRRARRNLQQHCRALANHPFAPGEVARATTATDLRVATLLSGDIAGSLSAAALLDSVAGGSLKHRVNRSPQAQDLLSFLLSPSYCELRSAATRS